MKTLKFFSLTLLMSIFCIGMTFAQQPAQGKAVQHKEQKAKLSAEDRATKQVEMMKTSLNLTPDQVTKLQAVQTQFAKDQDQARATKASAQDLKAKKDAYDAQVKSILTPDQYQTYQAKQASMRKGGMKQGQTVNKDANQKVKQDGNQGKHYGKRHKNNKANQDQSK